MNMKQILLYIFLCFTVLASAQQKEITVYGTIKDKATGEAISHANIRVHELSIGTASNGYGFYSLPVPYGAQTGVTLIVSSIGYETISYTCKAYKDTLINLTLQEITMSLGEVTVSAPKVNKITTGQMSMNGLDIGAIKKLPTAYGEVDVLKGLQLLPGVQTSHEGTANLSVRGGSSDQNLFLLDGAPVYNPAHALSFFSVFNSDALNNVSIYKGSFPARYGGRVSSVVDIQMKEGNDQSFSATGGIGLIASRLTLEAPINRGRGSFIVSGRYSYAGAMVNAVGKLGSQLDLYAMRDFKGDNDISFYDLNAKLNYKLGDKDRIYASVYTGRDKFYHYLLSEDNQMKWGNITGSARWNHIFNSRMFANTSIIYSNYDYRYTLLDDVRRFFWDARMQQIGLKSDIDWYVNTTNHVQFGFEVNYHYYEPGALIPRDELSASKGYRLDNKNAVNAAVYLSNEQQAGEHWMFNYGLRFSSSMILGPGVVYQYTPLKVVKDSTVYGKGKIIKSYFGVEPRLSMRYLINDNNSVKLGYSLSRQYQQLVSNSGVGLPTDIWLPADSYIRPTDAHQITAGYYTSLFDKQIDFSVEGYYKQLRNVIDFVDNANLFLNKHIETQVLSGKGRSYGIEFMAEKKKGKLTGWVSYTLSKTENRIEGINRGDWYSPTFDKRHNLAIALNYQINKTWSVGSTFKLSSGGYISIPEGTYAHYQGVFPYYEGRNGYKKPLFHELNVSAQYKFWQSKTHRFQLEMDFGVNNIYNQKNMFSLMYVGKYNQLRKMYLFGIVPFVSFNFKY